MSLKTMKVMAILFLSVVIYLTTHCVISTTANANANANATATTNDDVIAFNRVVMTWPRSLCKIKRCVRSPAFAFTMDGVFPVYSNGSELTNCHFHPFSRIPLSRIMPALDECWPGYTEKNFVFWERVVWNKGACTRMWVKNYFEEGLGVCQKIRNPILIALKQNDIVPRIRPYKSGYFNRATQSMVVNVHGKLLQPQVICEKDKDNNKYLSKVVFCANVELYEFNLRNCSRYERYRRSGCETGNIHFAWLSE